MKTGRILCLALIAALCPLLVSASAESGPVTRAEIISFTDDIREKASSLTPLNDPTGEDAESEDGTAFRYAFGTLYGDLSESPEKPALNAFLIDDPDLSALRGTYVNMAVNDLMAAIPCDNAEMTGTRAEALLYLTGDAETGFSYGRVQRDGQRISAVEYGVFSPEDQLRPTVTYLITEDYVDSIRVDGLREVFPAEEAAELFGALTALGDEYSCHRVFQSSNGAELEIFQESDLDFPALSYRTALPETLGDNVEDVILDNDDGTRLRRIDGEGFEAVFRLNGEDEPRLISYAILSDELEGPRCVRLGDSFREDFNRFRNGDGEFNEETMSEVLYGTVGQAPYGLAEYSNGDDMTLHYVLKTMSGETVELYLRYEYTVLAEIILHTLD